MIRYSQLFLDIRNWEERYRVFLQKRNRAVLLTPALETPGPTGSVFIDIPPGYGYGRYVHSLFLMGVGLPLPKEEETIQELLRSEFSDQILPPLGNGEWFWLSLPHLDEGTIRHHLDSISLLPPLTELTASSALELAQSFCQACLAGNAVIRDVAKQWREQRLNCRQTLAEEEQRGMAACADLLWRTIPAIERV